MTARRHGDLTTLRDDAAALLPDLVALRRRLHADPELGLHLPRTQRAVLDALAPLDLQIVTGTASTSVVALVRGGAPGPAVLLRADMDGLPLAEDSGEPFAARTGTMHACGHDLHVAGLVGAAHLLAARRDQLAGDVVLMFQPGEETGQGAEMMIAEGLLDLAGSRPVAAYAVHVVPGEPGVVSTRPGTIMAGSLELRIEVQGRAGHASAPHDALDPVPAAAALVQALQTFAARRFDALDPVVVSVTRLAAGGAALNIIPGTAEVAGTVRTLSRASTERVLAELPDLARAIAAAHGCSADVRLTVQCPVTVNDDALAGAAVGVLSDLLGAERVRPTPAPVMGSEDFAAVLQVVPGVLLFWRSSPSGLDPASAAPLHSPHVVFDDALLADQAAVLAALAIDRLAEN